MNRSAVSGSAPMPTAPRHARRRVPLVAALAACLAAASTPTLDLRSAHASGTIATPQSRVPTAFTLENGVTLLVFPIPGATSIAIQEIHPVGLIHDPRGVTQGTHLIEHLRCMGATASYPPGESFRLLSAMGLGNAETMGDVTHYDLVVPPDQLETALTIIAQRHTSLVIDDALIAQEAPRCAAEVQGVTQALGSPGFKFALAAAVQHWRHGRTDISLTEELAAWSAQDARRFVSATHDPAGLIVVVAGDVEPDEVHQAASDILGHLEPTPPADADGPPLRDTETLDLAGVPAEGRVTWDAPTSAAFVAYPPPEDDLECLALTIWSAGTFGSLHARLAAIDPHAMISTPNYPVGALPLMAFASVPRGANDPGDVGRRLAELLEGVAESPDSGVPAARQYASMLASSLDRPINGPTFARLVETISAQVGRPRAETLALGNMALEIGLTWHALGPEPRERLDELARKDARWWQDVIRGHVNADRRVLTVLTPREHAVP